MGITVSNPTTKPAISYNKVFLQSLNLTQEGSDDDTLPAVYNLKIDYKMYGVDENNVRYWESDVAKTVVIRDYLSVAMTKAATGDMDLINAMGAIEIALAAILEDQHPELGTASTA